MSEPEGRAIQQAQQEPEGRATQQAQQEPEGRAIQQAQQEPEGRAIQQAQSEAPGSEIRGFRKVEERTVYEGHVVTLAVGTFEGPDGGRFEREVVHHPGAVAVVALLEDGATVVLVRQYRSAIEDLLLELPAGKLDVAGEAAEGAAARELEEEIGYRAGHLEPLGGCFLSPGFCDERVQLFLATGLEACAASAQGVEEVHMSIEHVALDEAVAMVADGRITDAKTIVGLTLARDRLAARAGRP